MSCKYFCGVRGNTSDGRSSIGPPYKGCDGDNTVHPANTPQSHLCLPGDPEHACSDALLVWQTSAKHYYRSYLLHLLHRARHIQGNTGSSCGVNRTWGEEVTDLLHLSLFLISEEESKRIRLHRAKINPNPNPNLNRRNSGNSKEGLLERTCALSCCTEKYEHHCLSGENNRQGKRGEKSEIALCLQTVRGIVSHSSGLNCSNTAATAALCAAYGCHKEALRACRDHLSNCAGEGGEEGEVQVRAALLQSLQMSLCRLVKGLLHEQAVVPLSCHPTRGRDAAAAASRAPSMGGMSCEASKDVELAVKLLWISLVRSEGGEVNIRDVTPDCKKDDAGRIVDMVLGSIISCIMSSPLCLCPSYVALKTPDDGPWIGSRDRGSNDLKQKQGHENCDVKGVTAGDLEICFREFLRAVCIEDNTAMDSTHGQEGLTMGLLYNAPHEDKDTDTGTDTHDCPLPSPCLPLLRRLKTAVSVSVSRCILSALGSKLTRQFVRALPPMFSDHLDIDFFAELDD